MRFCLTLSTMALVVGSGACKSMQPVPLAFITETKPALVYVSGEYGMVQEVANPLVSGDTLFGTKPGGNQALAVPLTEVQRVSTRRVSSARTIGLVAGLVGLGAVIGYAVTAAGTPSNYYCDWSEPKRDGVRCDFAS
jgi:hypothetical protein